MTLTKEQLDNLKAYKALTKEGRLVVMPFVQSGEVVRFDARLYKRGVGGHIAPTPEALEAVGMPADWGEKAKALATTLSGMYPPLPTPEIIEAHAELVGLPAPSTPAPEGVEVSVSALESAEASTPESTPISTPEST